MRRRSLQQVALLAEEPEVLYGVSATHSARRRDPRPVVDRIREGLPFAEFEALRLLLGLTMDELASHLWISRSTLARRKKAGRFAPEESDRVVRFARLFGQASEVLGSREAAQQWLNAPARALGFTTPLSFAETEAGAREVEQLLGRIDYGVYS